ncbi:MAG: hypothetical protein ACYSW7_07040 [Planctomycetota bacterium]|jgi:hypothetical protein
MAPEFEFERKDSTGTVDLLDAGTDAINLVDGTYNQKVTTKGEWVKDTFKTIAIGTDPEGEIAALENLLQEGMDWHKYTTTEQSVWLRVKSDTGSSRRTLVKDWERTDIAREGFFDPVTGSGGEIISEWAITRHPDWEDITQTDVTVSGFVDMNGEAVDLYTDEPTLHGGSEIGRIEELHVANSSGDIRQLWIGIKPTGAAVTHDTVIPCEDANNNLVLVNSSTEETDGTGVTGTVVQTSFATLATYGGRFANSMYPKESTMFGQWVILLRAKLTASGEVMMRMGVSSGATPIGAEWEFQQDVYLTSTEWVLYEMGTITLPPGMWRDASANAFYQGPGDQMLAIAAERLSGSCELRCDEWIMIPYEHFLHLPEADAEFDIGSPDPNHLILTYEDDITTASGENIIGTGAPGARVTRIKPYQAGLNDWGYPRQGGLMIVAGNILDDSTRALRHNPSSTVTMEFTVFKRYKSYK